MMKLQDVILKAMAKKLTWIEAAEIAGMSVRNMQRKRQAYVDYGYTGLADHRCGKMSYHRIPMATAEKVLSLYQQRYFDLNVRHFHEKLREEHQIEISYSWVKQALQGAGLIARKSGAARTADGGNAGRCRACCCTLRAASTSGFRTTAG